MTNTFQKGDKVSFKNEKLQGVITQVVSDTRVMVELDNGFEIAAENSEILKQGDGTGVFEKFFKREEKKEFKEILQQETKQQEPYSKRFGNAGQISIVTLPADASQVHSGPVLFRIENQTADFLLVSLSANLGENNTLILAGEIKPNDFLESDIFKRNEVGLWKNLHADIIYFREENFKPVKPISRDVTVLLPDWKVTNELFKGINSFARIQTVSEISEQIIDVEKLKQSFETKEAKQFLKKNSTQNRFDLQLEVDLHIEEITDSFSHLSNSEILGMQLTKFKTELNTAIFKKAHSIIFIHGVGDGVLKSAVLNELKHYSTLTVKPASEKLYGQGATEVTLHQGF